MSVTWIEKRGLIAHLAENGYAKNHVDSVCIVFAADTGIGSAAVDTAVQALIDAFDEVPTLKEEKILELKEEGLGRIQDIFPSISDFDELGLIKQQYLSIAVAARNPTTSFQTLIDTATAGSDAATAINALTTAAAIIAYDVVTTPTWP